MNDADRDLDRLIAGAAPVSDTDVASWDLAGTEAVLLEALMTTTEIPDPAPPDPSPAGDGDAEVVPFAPADRRYRRRLVLVAAAAVAVVVTVFAATAAFDDPDNTTIGPAGAGQPASTGSADLRPADPPETVPVAPEDAAAAEALPRLAGGLEGWAITNINAWGPETGYMFMENGSRTLDVSWAPAEDYAEELADLESGDGERVEATLAGQPALTFDGGPVPAPTDDCADTGECGTTNTSDPPYEPGAHSYMTIAVLGDHTVRILGGSFPAEEYEALIAAFQQYPAASWVSVLPSGTILPSQRPAVVDEMLTGLPLPPGFDPAGLRAAPHFQSRFDVGADVSGTVACGWIDSWVAAKESGDQAAMEAAVDAMGTSPQWPVLLEMAETSVNFPGVLWQYAAAMPTDGPVPGGTELTVAESYQEALGCDRR